MDERIIVALVVGAILILMFFGVRRRGQPAAQEPTEEPAETDRVQTQQPSAEAEDSAEIAALDSFTSLADSMVSILSLATKGPGAEWRLEPATDRQMAYLRDIAEEGDITVPTQVTKGQASDCIGLFRDPSDDEIEMLKFFKLRSPPIDTQTHFRWALAPLLADPQRVAEWEARPANARLKDEIRFLGGTVPKGTTQLGGVSLRDELAEKEPEQAAKLKDLSDGYEEALDLETRVDEKISRFTWAQYRKAVDSMLEDDEEWDDVVDDAGVVHDRLKELYPRLEIK